MRHGNRRPRGDGSSGPVVHGEVARGATTVTARAARLGPPWAVPSLASGPWPRGRACGTPSCAPRVAAGRAGWRAPS